jgi:hypothetical protein
LPRQFEEEKVTEDGGSEEYADLHSPAVRPAHAVCWVRGNNPLENQYISPEQY